MNNIKNKTKIAIYSTLIIAAGSGIYNKFEHSIEYKNRMKTDAVYANIVHQLDSVKNEEAEWMRFNMAKKSDYFPTFYADTTLQPVITFADSALSNLFISFDATLDSLDSEANKHLPELKRNEDSLQKVLDQY